MKGISLWADTAGRVGDKRSLYGDIRTDVLVIGGGMAGILCAHKLQAHGVDCVVVEGGAVGGGVTHNTTAKITAQHRLIYDRLIRQFGREQAHRYYAVNRRAVEEYRDLAEAVPCDWQQQTAFVYSANDRNKLEREAAAYQTLGIPFRFAEDPPLPLATRGALGMEAQAQFHPLKLLYGLAKDLVIYEDTYVREIRDGVAITDQGNIQARHIILATHFPLVNIPGLYFMKLYQHRSYVIAIRDGPQLGGMYVGAEESGYSFRNYQDYLFIGGGAHKTGKQGGGYAELNDLAARAYGGREPAYAWAAQDCMTLDGMPYIGRHRASAAQLYVATGFNKWGMTGSMVAATLLTELITSGESEYQALFSPQRSMLRAQLLVNLGSATGNLLRPGGRRCTHMGCALRWNEQEQSWDCLCHGSRFDRQGRVINNPAKRGLKLE